MNTCLMDSREGVNITVLYCRQEIITTSLITLSITSMILQELDFMFFYTPINSPDWKKFSLNVLYIRELLMMYWTLCRILYGEELLKNVKLRTVFICSRVYNSCMVKLKAKQFLYRPGRALRASEVWGSQNSKACGTWRWQVCHPLAQAVFASQNILLVTISAGGWVEPRAVMRLRNISMKNSSNPIANRNHDLSACWAVKSSMAQRNFKWNSSVKYEVRQKAVDKKRVRRYAQLLVMRPFYVL